MKYISLLEQYVLDIMVRDQLIELFSKFKDFEIGAEILDLKLKSIALELLEDPTTPIELDVTQDVTVFITVPTKVGYLIYVPYKSILYKLSPGESAAAFLAEVGFVRVARKQGRLGPFKILNIALQTSLLLPILAAGTALVKKFFETKRVETGTEFLSRTLFAIGSMIAILNFILYVFSKRTHKIYMGKEGVMHYVYRTGLVSEYFSYYQKMKDKLHEPVLSSRELLTFLAKEVHKKLGRLLVPTYTGTPEISPERLLSDFADYVQSKIDMSGSLTEKEKEIYKVQVEALKEYIKKHNLEDIARISSEYAKRAAR